MSDLIKSPVDLLKDDDNYYGDFGRQFLSNSDISSLLYDPSSFKKKSDEEQVHFTVGKALHVMVCEPHKIDMFYVVDADTRASKKYKDVVNSGKKNILLKKDFDEVSKYAKALKENFEIYMMMNESGNEYEVPAIKMIGDLMWKGKTDIKASSLNRQFDVKTTGDIEKFSYNARKYNYDSQAFIYQEIFGLPLEFIVVCKKTLKIGRFIASDEFIDRGRQKVELAAKNYEKYFGKNKTEHPENYYLIKTLY